MTIVIQENKVFIDGNETTDEALIGKAVLENISFAGHQIREKLDDFRYLRNVIELYADHAKTNQFYVDAYRANPTLGCITSESTKVYSGFKLHRMFIGLIEKLISGDLLHLQQYTQNVPPKHPFIDMLIKECEAGWESESICFVEHDQPIIEKGFMKKLENWIEQYKLKIK